MPPFIVNRSIPMITLPAIAALNRRFSQEFLKEYNRAVKLLSYA